MIEKYWQQSKVELNKSIKLSDSEKNSIIGLHYTWKQVVCVMIIGLVLDNPETCTPVTIRQAVCRLVACTPEQSMIYPRHFIIMLSL